MTGALLGAALASVLAAAEVPDLRLILDKTTRRGEITFSGGRLNGGEVEYRRWKASRLERYVEAAVNQGILLSDWKERLGSRAERKAYRRGVDLAARIAFLMGVRDLIDHRIQELIPPVSEPGRPKDEAGIDRHLAARRMVKRELGKVISECLKAAARLEVTILRCPGEPPSTPPRRSSRSF